MKVFFDVGAVCFVELRQNLFENFDRMNSAVMGLKCNALVLFYLLFLNIPLTSSFNQPVVCIKGRSTTSSTLKFSKVASEGVFTITEALNDDKVLATSHFFTSTFWGVSKGDIIKQEEEVGQGLSQSELSFLLTSQYK